jgi:hypothetical protein
MTVLSLCAQYTLTGLLPFTQYLVSIQALNPKGAGPSATVVVMTDEGGQSPPTQILNIEEIQGPSSRPLSPTDFYMSCVAFFQYLLQSR